jgi:hypothetical protein
MQRGNPARYSLFSRKKILKKFSARSGILKILCPGAVTPIARG